MRETSRLEEITQRAGERFFWGFPCQVIHSSWLLAVSLNQKAVPPVRQTSWLHPSLPAGPGLGPPSVTALPALSTYCPDLRKQPTDEPSSNHPNSSVSSVFLLRQRQKENKVLSFAPREPEAHMKESASITSSPQPSDPKGTKSKSCFICLQREQYSFLMLCPTPFLAGTEIGGLYLLLSLYEPPSSKIKKI